MPFPATNRGVVASASRGGALAAFSLIEAVLAIAIAAGLLIVALVYYRQAADLRTQILLESDRASAMRLALDLLAGDLRTAMPKAAQGDEFTGDAISLRFVKQALNVPGAQLYSLAGSTGDLVRITISTLISTNGPKTEVAGLSRLEESLSPAVSVASAATSVSNSPDISAPAGMISSTNNPAEILTDLVRFVRFRYWDGATWETGWTNATPPPGVELVLAPEPLADDAALDAIPPEAFRRVVYLPSGAPLPQPQPSVETTQAGPGSDAAK